MKDKRARTEFIISVTAMITAVVAVVVGIVQTQVMQGESEAEREHQKLSVTPSVWLSRGIWDDGERQYLSYSMRNQGLGPAIIENFSVAYNGEPAHDWHDLLAKIARDLDGEDTVNGRIFPANSQGIFPGHVVPAGEALTPLKVNGDTDIIRLLVAGNKGIAFSLCYCSFYRDCWQVTELSKRAEPVNSCPDTGENFKSSLFREPKS